jgi:UDP-glucose 4-epimerase
LLQCEAPTTPAAITRYRLGTLQLERSALTDPENSPRSILVTGGSGYIGVHVVRALVLAGYAVIVVDRRPPPSEFVAGLARFMVGDVRDVDRQRGIMATESIAAVVHLAGVKSVPESMSDPYQYFDVNTVGTLRILEAMQESGIDSIVYSSSAAVYGQPDTVPIGETASLHPENPYGESKAASERLLAWWDRCLGVRHVALRYFNAAGAAADGMTGEPLAGAGNLVPVLLGSLLADRPVQVYGTDYPTPDGTAIRDYIHVEDLADAHVRAVDYLLGGGSSATLNLGTGQGASVAEVVAAAEAVTGRPVLVERAARRPGDPPAVWADPARARNVLGWHARRDLIEIIASAWRWHSLPSDHRSGDAASG